MAQTSITSDPAVGIAGQWADAQDGANETISKNAVETITAGKGVVLTVDDDATCEQPDATGEVTGGRFLGIALRPPDGGTTYAAGETVRIARAGTVWVAAEEAVTAGASAFCRFADPGATGLGSFRSDADTADAVALPNAIFASTTAAAGLAKVKLGGVFS